MCSCRVQTVSVSGQVNMSESVCINNCLLTQNIHPSNEWFSHLTLIEHASRHNFYNTTTCLTHPHRTTSYCYDFRCQIAHRKSHPRPSTETKSPPKTINLLPDLFVFWRQDAVFPFFGFSYGIFYTYLLQYKFLLILVVFKHDLFSKLLNDKPCVFGGNKPQVPSNQSATWPLAGGVWCHTVLMYLQWWQHFWHDKKAGRYCILTGLYLGVWVSWGV